MGCKLLLHEKNKRLRNTTSKVLVLYAVLPYRTPPHLGLFEKYKYSLQCKVTCRKQRQEGPGYFHCGDLT